MLLSLDRCSLCLLFLSNADPAIFAGHKGAANCWTFAHLTHISYEDPTSLSAQMRYNTRGQMDEEIGHFIYRVHFNWSHKKSLHKYKQPKQHLSSDFFSSSLCTHPSALTPVPKLPYHRRSTASCPVCSDSWVAMTEIRDVNGHKCLLHHTME